MGILSWLILGLIAGWIGSKIVNKTGEGFFLDIVLGVVGALVGGFLFSLFGAEGVSGLNLYSLLSRSSARSSCWWSITRSSAAARPEEPRHHNQRLSLPAAFAASAGIQQQNFAGEL